LRAADSLVHSRAQLDASNNSSQQLSSVVAVVAGYFLMVCAHALVFTLHCEVLALAYAVLLVVVVVVAAVWFSLSQEVSSL
jgi:hypothetical protein